MVDSSDVTNAGQPTADPHAAPPADAPRLPDAAPAPTPAPAPEPHAEPAVDELEERPAPKSSGTPVGFFVLMLMIVGAIVAIAAVVRPWESGTDDATTATSVATSAPTTTPATTSPATTTPATTTPPTTVPGASATTILVVAPLPTSAPAEGADEPLDPFDAQTEACATEQRTLEVAVEAFVILTGAAPSDAEALVTEGLLRPHPDGWATRWAFAGGDSAAVAPVPVPGGDCDL